MESETIELQRQLRNFYGSEYIHLIESDADLFGICVLSEKNPIEIGYLNIKDKGFAMKKMPKGFSSAITTKVATFLYLNGFEYDESIIDVVNSNRKEICIEGTSECTSCRKESRCLLMKNSESQFFWICLRCSSKVNLRLIDLKDVSELKREWNLD